MNASSEDEQPAATDADARAQPLGFRLMPELAAMTALSDFGRQSSTSFFQRIAPQLVPRQLTFALSGGAGGPDWGPRLFSATWPMQLLAAKGAPMIQNHGPRAEVISTRTRSATPCAHHQAKGAGLRRISATPDRQPVMTAPASRSLKDG